MPLLYFMISAYGGWVQIKSICASLIKFNSAAFPSRIYIFELVSHWNCKFVSEIETDCGLISIPTALRPSSFASTSVVPLPMNWSKIQSPGLEYRSIRFLGTYGDQFPRYFPECVVQLPLSGNDQIVVGSSLKLFGCKLISHAPFFLIWIHLNASCINDITNFTSG